MAMEHFEIRLLLAFLLGTLIGLERQWRHKLAGVKTNALVAIGAALFILVACKVTGDSTSVSRVAGQIVTGIGFLCAGVIMKEGFNVTGLNTAATVWCSSAIGTLCGMGYLYEPLIGTAGILACHYVLRPLEIYIDTRHANLDFMSFQFKISCEQKDGEHLSNEVVEFVKNCSALKLAALELKDDPDTKKTQIKVEIKTQIKEESKIQELMKLIKASAGVYAVSYNSIDLSNITLSK